MIHKHSNFIKKSQSISVHKHSRALWVIQLTLIWGLNEAHLTQSTNNFPIITL